MSVTFSKPVVGQQRNSNKARRKPVQAVTPVVQLDQPGRLRVCNIMAVLGISRASVYARVADGRLPGPDGHDGRPWWNTQTVRDLLAGGRS